MKERNHDEDCFVWVWAYLYFWLCPGRCEIMWEYRNSLVPKMKLFSIPFARLRFQKMQISALVIRFVSCLERIPFLVRASFGLVIANRRTPLFSWMSSCSSSFLWLLLIFFLLLLQKKKRKYSTNGFYECITSVLCVRESFPTKAIFFIFMAVVGFFFKKMMLLNESFDSMTGKILRVEQKSNGRLNALTWVRRALRRVMNLKRLHFSIYLMLSRRSYNPLLIWSRMICTRMHCLGLQLLKYVPLTLISDIMFMMMFWDFFLFIVVWMW